MTQLDKKINQLNNLIVINAATEKVYLDAFETTKDSELKYFFKTRAFQRSEFCRFLACEIRRLGGEPVLTDEAESQLKKGLPDLTKVLASKNIRAVFAEISALKKTCLVHYNLVLQNFDFSQNMKQLLEHQKQAISTSINTLSLRENLRAIG
jgi:uncharacterized protein (TIGR02284 family)